MVHRKLVEYLDNIGITIIMYTLMQDDIFVTKIERVKKSWVLNSLSFDFRNLQVTKNVQMTSYTNKYTQTAVNSDG